MSQSISPAEKKCARQEGSPTTSSSAKASDRKSARDRWLARFGDGKSHEMKRDEHERGKVAGKARKVEKQIAAKEKND